MPNSCEGRRFAIGLWHNDRDLAWSNSASNSAQNKWRIRHFHLQHCNDLRATRTVLLDSCRCRHHWAIDRDITYLAQALFSRRHIAGSNSIKNLLHLYASIVETQIVISSLELLTLLLALICIGTSWIRHEYLCVIHDDSVSTFVSIAAICRHASTHPSCPLQTNFLLGMESYAYGPYGAYICMYTCVIMQSLPAPYLCMHNMPGRWSYEIADLTM